MGATIAVRVIWATASEATEVALQLPPGATLGAALAASGLLGRAEGHGPLSFAVFGQRRETGYQLADGDRVEILRALRVTPNEARLLRAEARSRRARRPR